MPGDGASGPRVVIVGAGFAGLTALGTLAGRRGWKPAARAGRARPRLMLVDRNTYSTFQPLLYQVATAGLTSSDVAYPAWTAVHKAGAHFRLGEVTGLDTDARQVVLADGSVLAYDYLILASGVSAAFFGVPGAAEHALSLYTRRDAIILRNRVMAELRNIALPASFPEIDPSQIKIRLIELGPALLAPFNQSLRAYARRELVARGVEVMLGTQITKVGDGQVVISGERHDDQAGPGAANMLRSDITVWAAGVAAPAAIGKLGLPTGRGGRLLTGPDLRVAGQDRVFAAGDIGICEQEPVAQLAQPAIQQGRHAATQIARLEAGLPTVPFHYMDKGILATIGHRSAVAEFPIGIRARGTLAWLGWLALHLVTLLGGRNRVSALVNLSWRYLTWSRGGGVIIGDD